MRDDAGHRGSVSQESAAAVHRASDPQFHQICQLQGHQAGGGRPEESLHGGDAGGSRGKSGDLRSQVAQAVSLQRKKLGGELGNL